jgi:hypothetical protein
MITREQYLEALDIVETYHQQLRQYSVRGRSLKGWNDLQIGDKVIFSKTMSKDVLLEKEYEVVWIDSDFANQYDAWFTIKCENGKEKGLRKHAIGYRGRVA